MVYLAIHLGCSPWWARRTSSIYTWCCLLDFLAVRNVTISTYPPVLDLLAVVWPAQRWLSRLLFPMGLLELDRLLLVGVLSHAFVGHLCGHETQQASGLGSNKSLTAEDMSCLFQQTHIFQWPTALLTRTTIHRFIGHGPGTSVLDQRLDFRYNLVIL